MSIVAVLVATTGCGDSDSGGSATTGGAPTTSGNATVRFVGPEKPETFAPVIAAFEKANPNIKIEYSAVPFNDLNNIIQNRLSSKDSTLDVYTVDQPRVPALASRGFLVDLSGELPKVKGKVLQTSIDASMFQDKLWALPIWSSTQLLYYNKKLLAKAGVSPPSVSPDQRWTWEQLVPAAGKAQSGGAKWGFTFDQVSRYYQLQPLPESLGGGSGLTGADNLEPALTDDAWVKAMTFYGDLFKAEGGPAIAPRGVAPEQTPALFAGGKTAFFLGGPWWLAMFEDTKGLSFGVAPHPYFQGGEPKTPTDAWSWGLSPYSKNRDAALKFVEFAALSEEGSVATAKNAPFPPTNIAAFNQYLQQVASAGGKSTAGLDKLIETELNQTAVHRPRSIGYIQFEEIMNRALEDIRNGRDPRQTLDTASKQFDDAVARIK